MKFACAAIEERVAEVSLAQAMTGFVKRDSFHVIVRAIFPGKRIVVIDLSPRDIQLTVVVDIGRISFVVSIDDSKSHAENVLTSVRGYHVEEVCTEPSVMNDICYIVQASAEAV